MQISGLWFFYYRVVIAVNMSARSAMMSYYCQPIGEKLSMLVGKPPT
jgi:hypothetical protein